MTYEERTSGIFSHIAERKAGELREKNRQLAEEVNFYRGILSVLYNSIPEVKRAIDEMAERGKQEEG